MRRRTRVIALAACLTATGASLFLWLATGAALFTRFHDPVVAEHQQGEREIDRLFAEASIETEAGPAAGVANTFQFGLLPSTEPWHIWDRQVLSVFALAGPALLAAIALRVRARPRTSDMPDGDR